MFQLFWIPLVFFYYCFYNWLSVKNNSCQLQWYSSKWFWGMYFVGFLNPFWLIISKTSKQLVLDGFLYDFTLMISFPISMYFFGKMVEFNKIQYIGVFVIFVGFILLKLDNSIIQLIKNYIMGQ